MQLKELLQDIVPRSSLELVLEKTDGSVKIQGVSQNSQNIRSGFLFLATSGATVDRHYFVEDAFNNGAGVAIVSEAWAATHKDLPFPLIPVQEVDAIAPLIFAKFNGNPQNSLSMIGVTGTDGKTSVTTIVQTLIGKNICGIIGTNGMSFGVEGEPKSQKVRLESFNTTPGPEELYPALAAFKEAGATTVSMEVSSEAEHYGRLDYLEFDVLALTNITSEHLNTHGTIENYVSTKITIFTKRLKDDGTVILNVDDEYFPNALEAIKAKKPNAKILTYSMSKTASLEVISYNATMSGTDITFVIDGKLWNIHSPLLGDFNVENLACALLIGIALGHPIEGILQNLEDINIEGRLDLINLTTEGYPQDFGVIVDYAHTINGISRIFDFAKNIPDVRRIITVIGQAGERDKTKRSSVGKIVSEGSDIAIFTEDDPKNEPVSETLQMIIQDLNPKVQNYELIEERKLAIERAINIAQPNDLVMILGKGADNFMKVGNTKIPYRDTEEVIKALKNRANCAKGRETPEIV